MSTLRIGSRGSKLALWQANHIATLLRSGGHNIEIEIIHTTGDKITDVALAQVGTKGMFTKEIEEALAAGQVDLAVHSLKDLPTGLPPGFEIQLVASEPDIQKPMNLAFDARGRLWVTHSVEYPFAAADSEKSRDGLTILDGIGADGLATKITKFADRLNIPIGVLPMRR